MMYVLNLVEELVDIGNRIGSQSGEREAARRIRGVFVELRFCRVELPKFDINGW